jgi:glycosyltransferase involved in cell wall biosynthesis
VNILQITPGAGGMFCGNCFRDNALVAALRKLGHRTFLVPLYLPMRLDEEDQSVGTPIFFSGINVYLDQKSALFRKAPGWLRNVLASPGLLKWAAGKAAKTRAEDVGDLTLSMLHGEEGNQARELEEFLNWLATQPPPNVIVLSNALLVGMARRLKQATGAPVVCSLQGEDTFLDALAEPYRSKSWAALTDRARDIDLFIAPSRYYGELMAGRLTLSQEKIQVIYNGINLEGYEPAPELPNPPVLGYFARLTREKGLDALIEAFILAREHLPDLRLRVGGSCGPADEPFVEQLRGRLKSVGCLDYAEFHPNLDRTAKLAFLRSLTVFSVPALYGEAFGLYVIEALASGVPVVQPDTAAFPELIRETGGGLLCKPGDPSDLAEAILELIAHRDKFSAAGLQSVHGKFSIHQMAENIIATFNQRFGLK